MWRFPVAESDPESILFNYLLSEVPTSSDGVTGAPGSPPGSHPPAWLTLFKAQRFSHM